MGFRKRERNCNHKSIKRQLTSKYFSGRSSHHIIIRKGKEAASNENMNEKEIRP